ncbi:microcystin-dependent protein [Thioflavicoccus mobilis 8321]|uniref:Microcystin-dependent protein n=1 Tax=Thioflavicoccus mobilis 8321 TaxID=765912 RepID=L0H2G4_9GAMM|nr:tail fiber protein [Thioflavicoccus mobilis]AGA92242.1 microcystin-dependent protein [Thioflavicoccus mobilis 8321]
MSTLPFIGEISIYPYTFPPNNYATCAGQLIAIYQFQALYAVIGTIYGGDGRTTLGLPNLAGRAPMHFGTAPGLTPKPLGLRDGAATVELLDSDLPAHNHSLTGLFETQPSNDVDNPSVTFNYASTAETGGESLFMYSKDDTTVDVDLAPEAIGTTGSTVAHENRQPWLGLNFCIALDGLFPSRN